MIILCKISAFFVLFLVLQGFEGIKKLKTVTGALPANRKKPLSEHVKHLWLIVKCTSDSSGDLIQLLKLLVHICRHTLCA